MDFPARLRRPRRLISFFISFVLQLEEVARYEAEGRKVRCRSNFETLSSL